MKLSDKVQALIDSNVSAYEIAKKTGVAQPIITRLRNGERLVRNMSLGNAEKLGQYWDAQQDRLSDASNDDIV